MHHIIMQPMPSRAGCCDEHTKNLVYDVCEKIARYYVAIRFIMRKLSAVNVSLFGINVKNAFDQLKGRGYNRQSLLQF